MSRPTICTRRPLAALVAVLAAGSALAQSTQPTVFVTATRTPISVDAALASVSVITRDDIERAGGLDIVGLLRSQAGLDIVRSGGLGQQTSLFLRGANSNQVLVLVDGVRVASANSGSFHWEQLPLEQIERIEIVRGPRAALYGSDAIGGVVQIFTRRDTGVDGSLAAGSYDTWRADAGARYRFDRGHVGVRVGHVDSRGFSAQNERGFSFDPDRDGVRQTSIGSDAAMAFGAVRVEGSVLVTDQAVEYDRGHSDTERRVSRLAVAGDHGQPWLLSAANSRDLLDTPTANNRFESRRNQFDWQHALQPGRGELLWGLSLVDEHGVNRERDSRIVRHGGQREHQAGFASWRDGVDALQWELAARHDRYDGFGGRTSTQAALGWQVAAQSRLRLSMAEGFRAPNLNELYSPGFGGGMFAGNPDLGAERSRAWELGSEHQLGALWLSARAYRNDVRDLIDFAGPETFHAINVGRARMRGAEADWRWQAQAWTLAGTLTWLDARNRINDTRLIRRAPRQANLRVEHALGAGVAGIELHAVSARPEFGGDLPGYALLSGYLRWPLGEHLDLDLRLENLTDRDYEVVRGFNTAGASGLLTLRWRLGG